MTLACQTKRTVVVATPLLVVIVLGLSLWPAARAADDKKADPRIFELRTYTAVEGKLGDVLARFRDATNKLFLKHGMTPIGYWTPTDEPKSKNTLVYLLAFPNLETQKKAWTDFRADPEWAQVRAASEKNGKIVEKTESLLLTPTDFSQMQ